MGRLMRRWASWVTVFAAPAYAGAQQPSPGSVPLASLCARDATAGSATERTFMMLSDISPRYLSTSLRPLAPGEADSLEAEMQARFGIGEPRRCQGWIRPLVFSVWYNTARAHPDRDGAVWQGRGATFAVTGGAMLTRGPLEIALRPLFFATQNLAYTPGPFGSIQPGDFRDPINGGAIDLPYRFGARRYGRVDPGESYVRLAYWRVAAGGTTESQQWGPAEYYPLVRGTEGPAYPRVYAEARSVPLGIGRGTAHWEMGVLEASPFAGLATGQRSRVASAFMASFTPIGFEGLELGGARFFHVRRAPGSFGWSTASLPFSVLLKNRSHEPAFGGFNQLASVFFRLRPAAAGMEVYGEFYREDHNADMRDLAGEPDHESAYTLGFRRAWIAGSSLRALTVEHANGRITHLQRVRGESPIYIHGTITEGHTYLGQALGSAALIAGGAWTVAWSEIGSARSRDVAVAVEPLAQNLEGGSYDGKHAGWMVVSAIQSGGFVGSRESIFAEFRLGYGANKATNLVLGVRHQTSLAR